MRHETLYFELFRHKLKQVFGTVGRNAVARNGATEHQSTAMVHVGNRGFQRMPADVIEEHIHSVGAGLANGRCQWCVP